MADKNEIEFKVRVTDEGLAPLATRLDTVENKAEELGKTAATTGKQLDGMGGADGLAPLAGQLDKVDQKTDEVGKSAATAGKQLDGMGKVDGLATLPGQIDKVDQKTDELGKSAATTGKQLDGMGGQLTGIKNQVLALAGLDIGVGMIKDLAATADEFKNLEARIRLVVGANGDVAGTMAQVKDVAQETFTSLDGTTQLFSKLAANAKELGLTQQDALDITRTINQSIQVSGASAQASEAAVQQLVQGLQSGTLRGDEFNSVMEQAPRLAKALADGMGLPVGALRGLAEQGKLTSAVVVNALKGQREAIEGEFTQLPLTVGRAVQNLQTEFTSFVGVLDGTTGASSLAAQGIQALADHLDTLARVAGAAGAAMTAALAVQGVAALRSMSGSAAVLTADLEKIPKIISITVAAVGFEIGFQIGEWLHQNSELARKLGVGITEFLTNIVSDLQFVAEAAAAIFTDDTVGAAFDRYRDRAKEMEANFKGMYEDAKNAPAPIAEAANQAATSATAMGTAAQGAGTKVAAAGTAGAQGIAGIKTEADKAKDALATLEKSINLSDSLGIAKAGAELRELLNTGKVTADQFSEAWSKALAKNPDLVKFEQDAKLAFTGVEGGARLLSDAMDAGLREAIRRSGADFDLLSGGMGKAAQSALNDTDLIIGNLDKLKSQGVDTGRVLEASLSKAVNTADGQKSVDELRARIEAMRAKLGEKVTDGLLSDLQKQAEKLGATFEKLPEKAKTHADRVAEAFKDSGIKTQAELDKVAKTAEERFFLISTSGKASADGVAQAWRTMAEAQIAANGGVASEVLKAQAATYGLEIAVDKAGKTIVKAMGEGREQTDRYRKSVDEAAESSRGLGDAIDHEYASRMANKFAIDAETRALAAQAEQKRLGVDAEKFSVDAKGNRIVQAVDNRESAASKLESMGLDAETAKRMAARVYDERGNYTPKSSGAYRDGDTLDAVLARLATMNKGAASIGGAGQATPAPTRADEKAALAALERQKEIALQDEQLANLTGDAVKAKAAEIAQLDAEIKIVRARSALANLQALDSIEAAKKEMAELKAKRELTPDKEASLNEQIKAAQTKILDSYVDGRSTQVIEQQLNAVKQPSASGGSTNHTVVVQLGGRRTTVNTASAADSEALTGVIKELEAAALRSS